MCSRLIFGKGNAVPSENLNLGKVISFPTAEGIMISGIFSGHLRSEKFESYWKPRVVKIHVVPVKGFAEGRGDKVVQFNLRDGAAVLIAQMKNGELRVATKNAVKSVRPVHDRMPYIVPATFKPKTNERAENQMVLPLKEA